MSSGGTHRPRALWLPPAARRSLLVVGLILLGTMDDRHPGVVADGRQMAWTAVAIVETGELGQARGRDFTWPRPAGDAVSRFGMGMSLAQVPAAWLAPRVEGRFGAGSSQPLFLLAPLLGVIFSAAAAGWAAGLLGAGPAGASAAVLLASLASPLAPYASMDLSEPLQGLALVTAFAASIAATGPDASRASSRRASIVAGAAAGVAVLTKTSLLAVAPFALLLLAARTGSSTSVAARVVAATAGFAPLAGAWFAFEIARFGRPFASYAGEGFTHPFLEGAWRLLLGANRGLLLFYPALAVAFWYAARTWKRRQTRLAIASTSALAVLAALLALAAPWWAWHGIEGWGPRLLIPAIPLLAVIGGRALDEWRPWARRGVIGVCVFVNILPIVQHPVPVTTSYVYLQWPRVAARRAEEVAAYARRVDADGTVRIAPDQVLEKLPQASPWRVYPWFRRATWARTPDEAAHALSWPPWRDVRPDIGFAPPVGPDTARHITRRGRWNVWGRGFAPDPEDRDYGAVYDEGLRDQVVRAQQLLRGRMALELAQKLTRLAPSGETDALVLESLRLLGQRAQAADYLSTLPPERRRHPTLNVVLALFERDAGNEQSARALLASVAPALPGTPAALAVAGPFSAWPRDLFSMTHVPTDTVGSP